MQYQRALRLYRRSRSILESMKQCVVSQCGDKYRSKGLCAKHYWRQYAKEHRTAKRVIILKSMNKQRFGGLRDDVLKRDNYCCLGCGMTNEEHKQKWNRNLTLDHIDNQGRFSKEPNNSLDNLQTLCLKCHGRKDSAKFWTLKGA